MKMDRRRFIEVTAAGAAVAVTGWACADIHQDVGRPAILEMLGADRTREIGTLYRVAVPQESTAAALRSAISSSRPAWIAVSFRRPIDRQVHDDFEGGRVVMVGGWILSVTEARQCALYSLTA